MAGRENGTEHAPIIKAAESVELPDETVAIITDATESGELHLPLYGEDKNRMSDFVEDESGQIREVVIDSQDVSGADSLQIVAPDETIALQIPDGCVQYVAEFFDVGIFLE